jgi:hypothetical protein
VGLGRQVSDMQRELQGVQARVKSHCDFFSINFMWGWVKIEIGLA